MRSRQLKGCASRPSATAPQHNYFPPDAPQRRPSAASSLSTSRVSLGVLSPPLTPEDPYHPTKTRSKHVEPGPYGYYPPSTNGSVREGIMPPSSYPPSTRPAFTFGTLGSSSTEFTFRILPRPEVPMTFSSRPPLCEPRKRYRAVADVDGEHSSLHKKKRRLRLFLITSRLSPQFSHPATNIVDRGSSKIAVWAKQKASGRNILRKAAILNRIRRQSICALETAGGLGRVLVEQEKEQEQLRLARLTLMYGSPDSGTRPVSRDGGGVPHIGGTRTEQSGSGGSLSAEASSAGSFSPPLKASNEKDGGDNQSPNDAYAYSHGYPKPSRPSHLPLPPSPLGLSNYDALDLDDDLPDPYAHLDEEYGDEENEHMSGNGSPWRLASSQESSDEPFKTESQRIHSDSGMLDPDEPVIGDYDQVDEGANVFWSTAQHVCDGETDRIPEMSLSPMLDEKSNASSATLVTKSPNFTSSLSSTSSSPNFAGFYVTSAGWKSKEPEDE